MQIRLKNMFPKVANRMILILLYGKLRIAKAVSHKLEG